MGNEPSSASANRGRNYQRTNATQRPADGVGGINTAPLPNPVNRQASAENPVRCPRCRRLLAPPAGHSRFLCPCGQMLTAPSQPIPHVKCPRCQTTLAPPPNAEIFRCVCGTALTTPPGFRRQGPQTLNPTAAEGPGNSAVNAPGGGKYEDENLLPDEVIATQLQKPADEHWLRNTGPGGRLYWVRLTSEEQERKIQELQRNCAKDMETGINELSPTEIQEKLDALGVNYEDAFNVDDLSKTLLTAPATLQTWSTEDLRKKLNDHNTDYTNCITKDELVEKLMAVAWYGEHHFADGFVRDFSSEFDLAIVPAQQYSLDPEFATYKITPSEIEGMTNKPFKEKVRWFREQCKRHQIRWEDGRVQIKIRRGELLRDSFNNFNRLKPIDLRRYLRFEFIGEEGVDAGGVAREWFELVTDACFNVDCGLFEYSGVDNICYQINPASGIANELHEQYFHFLGRVVGKALFDHKFIRAHVTQPIYKHILGYPITLSDIQFSDAGLFQSLEEMQGAADVSDYMLTFTTVLEVFGENQEIELKPDGGQIEVTKHNLSEYIQLMTKYYMFERTKSQLAHFLRGIYDVIPPVWLSIFDYRELELLLCGLPNINVADWKKNTKYRGQYAAKGATHKVVKWFWEIVEDSTQEQRALILQFCTGTSRVPVQGFEALQGNDGNIKPFTIDSAKLTDIVYPKAHTCFNRIELPMYRSKQEMIRRFEEALSQGATGFSDE